VPVSIDTSSRLIIFTIPFTCYDEQRQ
jgi:hypothetical protein